MNLLRIYWQGMVQTFRNPQVRKLLVLIFVTIGAATVFYHFQEHWGWIDALYFSVITLSTVGYGDFSPQTPVGKLFTVGYILCGLGMFVITTATFAEQFIQRLKQQIAQNREPPC